jgi:hypothetical protein
LAPLASGGDVPGSGKEMAALNWAARDPASLALQDTAVESWLVKAGSSDRLWSRQPTDPHGSAVATWFRDSGIGAECITELENLEQEGELGQFMLAVSQYKVRKYFMFESAAPRNAHLPVRSLKLLCALSQADGVEVGSAMALDGLASSPELNGQAVVVMAFLVERGRYQCELLDGGRKLAVLAKRLRKLTESEAAGVATQMEERAAAEQAELAGLAAALEQEELQKANTEDNATTAEEEEDGGTVITGGDVDWAAVDNPGGGSGAAAGVSTSAEVQMEAGERFVYEIRYTLNAPAEAEGAEVRTLGTAGTVIREDAAGAGAVLVAGFVHLAGSAEAMAVLLCTTCATTAGAAGSAAAAGGELVAVAIATADGPDYPEQGQLTPTRDATDEELGATRAALSVGRLGEKTPFFAPFIYKMHYFTKTGSGQTHR